MKKDFYKKIRSTLNKLAPQKFQTLVRQVTNLKMEINTEERLKGVADMIFKRVSDLKDLFSTEVIRNY